MLDIPHQRDQARTAVSHGRIATAELARFVRESVRSDVEPVGRHIVFHMLEELRLAIELIDPKLDDFHGLHLAIRIEQDRC